MTRFRFYPIILFASCTLMLAGCESDEEKAERYYQSGLSLLEQGDTARAIIELRNVFDHDGFHKEARLLYADLMLEEGRTQEANGQYLRLIEQYPDIVEARVALAELAIAQGNWPEVERHGAAAFALTPDLPNVKSIDVAIRYRQAVIDSDDTKRDEIAVEAEDLLEEIRSTNMPDNDGLVRVIISNYIQNKDPLHALDTVNAALERTPMSADLNLIKVSLLVETNNTEGTGAHLQKIVDMFPENALIKQMLIRWYLSQDDVAGAEAFMRSLAGDADGPIDGHVAVIQFLEDTQGVEAAEVELLRLQEANKDTENGRFYASLLASTAFQRGDQDKAIADIRTILDSSEPGTQKTRQQVLLVQMLLETGETADAYALVDTILEADASNVPALRIRATQLIQEDKPSEAILALRTALNQSPRDAGTLTLMAQAHERTGDTNLVGENLALAVEASNSAVPEVLRYARFLAVQDRQQVAVTLLEDARRQTPGSLELIAALANQHLRTGDWQQAQLLVQELQNMDTQQASQAAVELEVQILQRQGFTEESLMLLQGQLNDQADTSTTQKMRSTVLIVQTQIREGKTSVARTTLDEALIDLPDSLELRMISALLHANLQEFEQAEVIYRDLMEEFPQTELPVRMLVNLLNGTGRSDDAHAILLNALDTLPNPQNLMLLQANFLESTGDFGGAITIYEELYNTNRDNLIIANNLASLIATYSDDADSLARAANIARRLRGTEEPALQDTYGWIAYRLNNYDEALEYLEPAATALAEDVLTQYHLGMTYVALGRTEDAKAQLQKTLLMAGDSSLPQFERARETLAGLD